MLRRNVARWGGEEQGGGVRNWVRGKWGDRQPDAVEQHIISLSASTSTDLYRRTVHLSDPTHSRGVQRPTSEGGAAEMGHGEDSLVDGQEEILLHLL